MQFPVLIQSFLNILVAYVVQAAVFFSLVGMNKNQSSLKEEILKLLIGHIMYGQNFVKQAIKSVGLPPDFFLI